MKDILRKVAIAGDKPSYTPYGYIIGEDGKVYSLLKQFTHGVVLALLYPEKAKEQGYELTEDYDVFEMQRFELDNHHTFPVCRVSIRFSGAISVSKGDEPLSAKQIMALTKIFRVQSLSMNDTVETDIATMTCKSALNYMAKKRRSLAPTQEDLDSLVEPDKEDDNPFNV